jgi:siroheme synthase
MGVGGLALSASILSAGRRGSGCPVAIIENGYGTNQRVTVGTLGDIASLAATAGVSSPAVIVVGDVVLLSPHAPGVLQIAGKAIE